MGKKITGKYEKDENFITVFVFDCSRSFLAVQKYLACI
jgi:hypothetical protein